MLPMPDRHQPHRQQCASDTLTAPYARQAVLCKKCICRCALERASCGAMDSQFSTVFPATLPRLGVL
ncbi:MAG: hypothetical protein ACK5T1_00420, partial [Betaproteobacteria bacterium]